MRKWPVFALLFFVSQLGHADQAVENSDKLKLTESAAENLLSTNSDELPIHVDLKAMAELEISDPQLGKKLNVFDVAHPSPNIAERYLLLIVKAKVQYQLGQFNKAVNYLKQAVALDKQIPKDQLHMPEFIQVHTLLAKIYDEQQLFEQAFAEKKKYLEKYREYRETLRKARLERLNEKYKTDIKVKENELLQNEQKIKELKLEEAKRHQLTQQRNLIVLLVTAIMFTALLVRQLRLRKKLRHLAKTDALTGLYNRRTLFQLGNKFNHEARAQQQVLSVLMIDIDHFKSINDNYGHDAGDSAIKLVAQCGVETFRNKDIFARIGGEEFAVILPATEMEQARAIAERFREKVQQLTVTDYADKALDIKLSISIGVAQSSNDLKDFDQLLHQADLAMYQAKSQGRNRVRG